MDLKSNIKDYSMFLSLIVVQVVLVIGGLVLLNANSNRTALTTYTAPTKEITDENKSAVQEPQVTGTATERGLMVNINTDSAETIALLPQIGEVTAQKIVDYRNQNGLFKSLEDVKNVEGVGDQTFENIKPYITLNSQ